MLYTYLQVDPVGHREELERGFSYLDQQITKEPVEARYVLSYRWIEYLRETQRWQEVYERAQELQALVDRGDYSAWWRCWALYLLCEACNALGRVEELAGCAAEMAEVSQHAAPGYWSQ